MYAALPQEFFNKFGGDLYTWVWMLLRKLYCERDAPPAFQALVFELMEPPDECVQERRRPYDSGARLAIDIDQTQTAERIEQPTNAQEAID